MALFPGRHLDEADASGGLEVIHDIDTATSPTEMQARITELEIELARVHGTQEEDAARLAAEVALLKAQVADLLGAIGTRPGGGAQSPMTSADVDERVRADLAGLRREVELEIARVRAGMTASLAAIVRDSVGEVHDELREAVSKAQADLKLGGQAIHADLRATVAEMRADLEEDRRAFTEETKATIVELTAELSGRQETFEDRILGSLERARRDLSKRQRELAESTEAAIAALRAEVVGGEDAMTECLRALTELVQSLQKTVRESDAKVVSFAGDIARFATALEEFEDATGARLDAFERSTAEQAASAQDAIGARLDAFERVSGEEADAFQQQVRDEVAAVAAGLLKLAGNTAASTLLARRVAELELRLAELSPRSA